MRETHTLVLRGANETACLGRILARAMAKAPFSLLMTGDLGCGKTTLTRALVEALPGGERAETSSPSFTLCNVYPTTPPIVHCDLYRQGAGSLLPDEVADMLFDGALLICEWSEYLAPEDMPADALLLGFGFFPKFGNEGRKLVFDARGTNAQAFLKALPGIWEEAQQKMGKNPDRPKHSACEIGG